MSQDAMSQDDMSQYYIIDCTLIKHKRIILAKFYITTIPDNQAKFKIPTIPDELQKNKKIRIKLNDNNKISTFEDCPIGDSDYRPLLVPDDVITWIRREFPFSIAFFESHVDEPRSGVWKQRDIDTFYAVANREKNKKTKLPIKMDIPAEALSLSWKKDNNGNYLLIEKGFSITQQNATEFLSEKALASILPYIFNNVANTFSAKLSSGGKKCNIIQNSTPWLSAKEYSKTSFSHPGLYILRRNEENGDFAYYIGKSVDIKSRIIKNNDKLSHPNERDEDNKQYDDIACISINFNDIAKLYGNSYVTPLNNPGVKRGCDIDNALYAIEDIAIHTVAMILLSEGKKLDNKQYRSYTSQWL